jgi:Flp pilus assembly protein TadG
MTTIGLTAWLRCTARSRRGNVAIETALIFPVLLVLLLGVFQFGNIMYTRSLMADVARESARSFAVGATPTVAATQALATARLAAVSTLAYVVAVTPPAAGGTDVTVTITVPLVDAALIGNPYLGAIFTGNLQATATMRVT